MWNALTEVADTGDSPIISYQLLWDDQTGVVNLIASDSLSLNKILVGLSSAIDFKFKVRAKNVYGYG